MKTIFITIARGSLITNFFRTGAISHLLDKGIKVVVLTPNYEDKELFKDFEHPHLILEPLISPKKIRFKGLVYEFLKAAAFNKTVFVRYLYRFAGSQPDRKLFLPRIFFLAPLSFIPGFRKFARWFDLKTNPQPEHDYLFAKYKPDLVFATTAHAIPDIGVLKSAQRFNIHSVQMPKSWDNLSKLLFNVKADKMLVWSDFMKKQAVRFQDYADDEVIITGCPQFDYYTKQDRLLSREKFCRQFGFDPNKKIILYASTGGNCRDEEADYLKLIKQYFEEKKLEPANVLIRPHVKFVDDDKKFVNLEGFENFVVDRTGQQNFEFKDNWDISQYHLDHLFNSLYHADVCINIASTMTLDAAACGTQVINLNFDLRQMDKQHSIKRLNIADYIDEVISFGATWMVNDKQGFLNALQEILVKGKTKKQVQEKFIKHFMYKLDGHSAERISQSLMTILAEDKINTQDLKKLSIQDLRNLTQKTAAEHGRDPLLGLARRVFSIYFTWLFLRTRITANQITALSMLIFFIGISLFAFNIYWLYFLAILLIWISIILDASDGEVARLKSKGDISGGTYAEPVSHDIQYGLMYLPLILNAYAKTNSLMIIYIGFAATITRLLFRLFTARFNNLIIEEKERQNPQALAKTMTPIIRQDDVNWAHKIYRYINRNFFSSIGFVMPLLALAILDRIDLFLWLFAIYFIVLTLVTFLKQVIHISQKNKKILNKKTYVYQRPG